jgi:hypothetical protein
MLRSATACAVLSLSLGLALGTTAHADPVKLTGPMEAVQRGQDPSDGYRIAGEQPDGAPLVNRKNGKPVTLEMVQNDIDWRAQTAESLKPDSTSEATD